jgi:hypothetical protein
MQDIHGELKRSAKNLESTVMAIEHDLQNRAREGEDIYPLRDMKHLF